MGTAVIVTGMLQINSTAMTLLTTIHNYIVVPVVTILKVVHDNKYNKNNIQPSTYNMSLQHDLIHLRVLFQV